MSNRNRLSVSGCASRALFFFFLILGCSAPSECSTGARPSPVGPRLVPGWPVILGNRIHGAPAVADLDGDGKDELAVALRDGQVFLLDGHGRTLPGWPQTTAYWIVYSPLLADIDGDGDYEVFAASWDGHVYAWRTDGSALPGWPVDFGVRPSSSPQLVFLESGRDPSILVPCIDGNVHLLDPRGKNRPGWPRRAGGPRTTYHECHPTASADLDGDGSPEILFLSYRKAVLHVWRSTGSDYPGFPLTLGTYGIGITLDRSVEPARIVCTMSRGIVVLDTEGRRIMSVDLPDGDAFTTAAAFVSVRNESGETSNVIVAGTSGGAVYAWDEDGRVRPGWPIQLGGFIYGLSGPYELFGITSSPKAWDVDFDGDLEILVGSADQHVYCFELDGELLPGWPVSLDDGVKSSPVFAQLDGVGDKEIVVAQGGEAVFAYHIDAPETDRGDRENKQSGFYAAQEWPPRYFVVTAAIFLLVALLVYHVRFLARTGGMADRPGSAGRIVLVVVIALLLVRGVLFVGEIRRYSKEKKRLGQAGPVVHRILRDEQKRVQQQAVTVAADLDSCNALEGTDPIKLLYHLERLADHYRLDFQYTGLLVTDETGRAIQAVGLARGWTHTDVVGLDFDGENRPVLLEDTPVFVGQARLGEGEDAGHFFLFSSLLSTLPHVLADATGSAVHVRVNGRTLAWAGAPPQPSRSFWPWLGFVEPTSDVELSTGPGETRLSLRLVAEYFDMTVAGWMDLCVVLLLSVLYYMFVLRRGKSQGKVPKLWWFLSFALVYAVGWYLVSRWQLIQRPVPFAGHSLEFLLHLTGLLGFATVLRAVVGTRRGRRLSFAVIGSYLVVGLLPLALVLFITTGLLQQAQRRVIQDAMTDLEEKADHLVMAYPTQLGFMHLVRQATERLMGREPETDYFNLVGEDEYLYNYGLPTAYLTLWVRDSADSSRYFTGFSWRAPRAEKFYSRLPDWAGDRNLKGLFLDGGKTVARATRTIRHPDLGIQVQLASHIPLDRYILEDLEERLRILPFLPPVRLEPAWLQPARGAARPEGWRLPFSTTQTLPARDWRTGAPRGVAYRASAYLPAGREKWTVLSAVIAIALLPLILSFWGAFYTFKRTVRPLTRLLTGIRRVEKGDLEYRLADTGQTEIALAAQAFDKMADSLKLSVQELAEKKKIEEVSALKTQFISMVSHDLKTPLASIKGATENVLEELAGPITDKQRTYLEMILSSSKNLQQMISDILDLSHIESGRLVLNIETLDAGRESENVIRSVQALLDERRISTKIMVAAEDAKVRADRTRFWQIVNNLVSNAVRYSPVDGLIRILIEDAPGTKPGHTGFLRISISDEGPGVPGDDPARLFEPFHAGPAGSERKYGAGLGLAIVKQLVELQEGEVSLENNEQGGARFSFTVPAAGPARG